MKISSNFDSGNIEVLSINNGHAELNIRKDTNSDFLQWFHFRATDVLGLNCRFELKNAGQTTYPDGWKNYEACASYDRKEWFRVPTTFEDGVLTIDYTPNHNSIYFAYFAPYSYEQHQDLIHEAQLSPLCSLEVIGQTVEGRDMDMLIIGEPGDAKKNVWVIGRQHPGESMTEWFIEGMLSRLLDEDDSLSRKLLEQTCFYVIPNMNPDGAIAGNLRANAAGENLNRAWAEPDAKKSPEVYHTLKKMDEIGIDFMLDVHGDEALPYNFVTTSEGVPGYTQHLHDFEEAFKTLWMRLCPDFQDEFHYPKDEPGKANLTVCSNAINHRFRCPSFTLEMPFKDNTDLPDPVYGWSPERSKLFGETFLSVLLNVLPEVKKF